MLGLKLRVAWKSKAFVIDSKNPHMLKTISVPQIGQQVYITVTKWGKTL